MAIPDRDTSKRSAEEDRKGLPPRDRDQRAESAARTQDVADAAEVAANRKLPGDASDTREALPARGHLEGADAPSSASGTSDSSEERRKQIAERAYYKAQQRGFTPGSDDADWLEAEKEHDGPPGGKAGT